MVARWDGRFVQSTADLRHSFRPSTTSKPFIATSLSRRRPHYRATDFTPSPIRRLIKSTPTSSYSSTPSLSTTTLTTLVPWLGFPDLPESRFWRRREVENPPAS